MTKKIMQKGTDEISWGLSSLSMKPGPFSSSQLCILHVGTCSRYLYLLIVHFEMTFKSSESLNAYITVWKSEETKSREPQSISVFFLFLKYNLDNEPTAKIQLQAKNKKLLYKRREKEKYIRFVVILLTLY